MIVFAIDSHVNDELLLIISVDTSITKTREFAEHFYYGE